MYFNQVEFGQRIREERNRLKMTQEDLAQELNIGYVHMNGIENGRKGCSIDLLLELSELFGVSTDYLLTGKTHSNEETKLKIQSTISDLTALLQNLDRM